MSDNIKVVVKVRPLISREIDEKLSRQWRVKNNTLYQIDQNGKDILNGYTFDKVYDESTKTVDVYNDVAKPIVEAAAAGFNGTIFAYGQTSSGKTYTMTGTEESLGIIPLSVMNLFDIIKNIPDRDFLIRVSYVEIYNETLIDLLNIEKKNIKIHDTLQGVKVDATVRVTTSPEEVLQFMKEGQANRQTGSTNMNVESSRSHSIFQITVESREQTEDEEVGCLNVSQLNLVDLAGSERSGQTGATGIRFKEGTHINKSLSSLALVIKQLSEGQSKHVSYRDSKLTRILQNSLGGNAKTSIICAVTPAAVEETISTLQFASRAKAIKNSPEVNVVATDTKMIDNLTRQLSSLKTQLESKRNVEEDNYKLQKQITVLQRFLKGFGQHTSTDIMTGSRRKLQQLRRATISTPHIRQEDPTPSVPRFCTPSLKYNPALVNSMTNLAIVPEEPIRNITPPPQDHRTIENEIIELDSDDDGPSDVQACSPYHKCFNSSKTPPCVLRKSAKEAEKNFKDLVELTGREKIYSPNVVDLLEKLEGSTVVIANLEKNIDTLNKMSKKNELEMENLKEKIIKAEEEVRNITSAKLQLEARCMEYETKLTDWEVMYDTLKKKAKNREEELLNRLDEFANVKNMNQVKSDTKTLSLNISQNIEEHVKDLKEQLSERDYTITDLEAKLHAQNVNVLSLETQAQEIQTLLHSCQGQLSKSDDENSLHKTTIKTLNSIIENQKSNLEITATDLETANDTIQTLQDELNKKEKLLKTTLTDTELDNLIMNKEKMITNNENINNIIQSLKVALESKNNEIKTLKLLQNNETFDKEMSKELGDKQTQVEQLQEKVTLLEVQLEENSINLTRLLEEKSNLLITIQVLNDKLSDFQKSDEELCNRIKTYESELTTIKELNQELENKKQHFEAEIIEINSQLTNQVKNYLEKISNLEDDLKCKNTEIDIIKRKTDVSTYENRVKEIVTKLQGIIIEVLTVETKESIQLNDNDLDSLETLDDKFNALENTAIEVADQIKRYIMRNTVKHLIPEICSVKSEINMLESVITNSLNNIRNISGFNESLNNGYTENNVHNEEDDENNLQQFTEEHLSVEDSKSFLSKIDIVFLNLKQKIENVKLILISSFDVLVRVIERKNSEIAQFTQETENLKANLEHKSQELLTIAKDNDMCIKEKDIIINDIFQKIVEVGSTLNIENNLSCDSDNVCENKTYTVSQMLPMLDNMVYEYLSKSKQLEECTMHTENLVEAQNKVHYLTNQNLDLIENISKVTKSNSDIAAELQVIRKDNESLAEDLITSAELLKDLKDELKIKTIEIGNMEGQVLKWKEQFVELDILMKKQLHDIQEENTKLRKKCLQDESKQLRSEELDDTESNKSNIQINAPYKTSLPDIISVLNSPPSLLTISCNKIIEFIQDLENNTQSSNVTPSTSKSHVDSANDSVCSNICFECDKLKDQVKILYDKNTELTKHHNQLKATNDCLTKEMQDAHDEIKGLLRCTNDLQKKILNHKTNLSTLTATTYAENKSLSSQLKFLQHHLTRFHMVCQRDLPQFKEQLCELMTLLKEENLESKLNASFKRYSLPVPLDSNSIMYSFNNESTLDGDILMLDTNLTVNTTADNTLTGLDQTCCEITEAYPCTDTCLTTSCFLNELTSHELCKNQNIIKKLDMLRKENERLNQLVYDSQQNKPDIVKVNVETMKQIPIIETSATKVCTICKQEEQRTQFSQEIGKLNEKLLEVTNQKNLLQKKYNDLSLEVPSTEGLLRKLHNFEKELENKSREIEKLSNALKSTKDILSGVQEENDNLSTQVMEFLSEIDDLKKELETEREHSKDIQNKNNDTNDNKAKLINCQECIEKDEHIKVLQSKYSNTHTRLNRSYSDSDTSSHYNKICTLQNELDAGREDCNELKEEVTTIKNQLESNNLSMSQAMDLDESIGETSVADTVTNKPVMPKITEEHAFDIYNHDKLDCFNFYMEKIGDDKTHFNTDVKIIDLMKTLYCKLMTEHESRIEIMFNQMNEYENSKLDMQEKINNLTKDLALSDCTARDIEEKLTLLRNNIRTLGENAFDCDTVIQLFNEKVLVLLDREFSINLKSIFETILQQAVSKNFNDLNEAMNKYGRLEEYTNKIKKDLESVNNESLQLKYQLSDKENEFNLLAAQKVKIHEINNALTMDLVKKEEELSIIINETCRKLDKEKILMQDDINNTSCPIEKIQLLIDLLMHQNNSQLIDKEKDIDILKEEITKMKSILEEKSKELLLMTKLFEKTKELSNKELKDMDVELQTQKSLYDDLNTIYNTKVEESNVNCSLIQKLSEEVGILKKNISAKDMLIQNLLTQLSELKQSNSESESKVPELLHDLSTAKQELDELKVINQNLTTEKEEMANEFERLKSVLERNKTEREKMESNILLLKKSVKENDITVDNLKSEMAAIMQQNTQLKDQLDDKCKELSRLEFNIKTHETTAKIQTKMISRLQKQKDDDANIIKDKELRLAELEEKCEIVQKESVLLNDCITALRLEVDSLKHLRQSLEEKVTYLESQDGGRKARSSIESITDSSRRRRQSIHDSMRTFDDNAQDQNKVESVPNGRPKADELMDVDEDSSYHSTPVRLTNSKGRDSLVSKNEESEEEDHASRSSSAMAVRHRRQSTHDRQRLSLRNTPETQDVLRNKSRDKSKPSTPNHSNVNSTVMEVQERLSTCQQELEELKERYRELDEECEICAQYLKERDEQCGRLKKEKAALEKIITELNEKIQNTTLNTSRASFADAAVNTDQDWTNLHSVVVDRMSYDAELEKNKRLTRTIEELRFNKQELKMAVAKLQRALEEKPTKHSKELERTKVELNSCREELEDVKRRNKELDEECETCVQYLRERDEQCRLLKASNAALEAKLQQSKKSGDHERQTLHNQVDASTEISEDFLSCQVERDAVTYDTQMKHIKKLKAAVEKLTEQKDLLEQQLMAAPTAPVYVATGSAIVQNQQLTDVMKENQKLKKMNTELISLCKKRGKALVKSNRENQDPTEEI